MLHSDPEAFLYPYIQRWPLPNKSGETLLVERRGDRVFFLNELRFRKGTALKMSASLNDPTLPAAMAVRGRRGSSRESTTAACRSWRPSPLCRAPTGTSSPGSTGRGARPIRRRGWLTAGFTLVVVAVGAAGALLLWRLRERQAHAELVASELRYRTLLENLTVGVVVHAADTGIILSNAVASRLLGLSREQLHGKRAISPSGTSSTRTDRRWRSRTTRSTA